MLDHRAFVAPTDTFLDRLRARGVHNNELIKISELVLQRRQWIQTVDAKRHELKTASGDMQRRIKSKDQAGIEQAKQSLKQLKKSIKEGEAKQKETDQALDALMMLLPNIPHDSVPIGANEQSNRVEREVGQKPEMNFTPRPHWEIGESLGILDFEAGVKLSGARFVVYRGAGARLERALHNYMLDSAVKAGYVEMLPPVLVRRQSMLASGQYPKFEGESFETRDGEYALIPTSEVPLVNLHRDEIVSTSQMPVRYTAFSPCFRKEAGAAGADTRGLIRLHQFNKVELVSLTTPEQSDMELERLTGNAESLLQALGLAYRVVTLCTGDLGFCASKTYDIEVWLPGQNAYREISSCSNCGDFQARRAHIRYRPEHSTQKPRLVHTLNGSALAIGRTVVAILENGQRADGTVRIPDVLVPYMGSETIG